MGLGKQQRAKDLLGQPPQRVASRGMPGGRGSSGSGSGGGRAGGAAGARKSTRIRPRAHDDGPDDQHDHDHDLDHDLAPDLDHDHKQPPHDLHDQHDLHDRNNNHRKHKLPPPPSPSKKKQQTQQTQPRESLRHKSIAPHVGDRLCDPDPSICLSSAFLPNTMIIERKIKLVTEQHNIDKPPQMEGFPMKEWTVELYILDEAGKERPARCFQKVVYNLHPSFENPIQTFHEPPFSCKNEGWGEFEMTIDCFTTEKGGKQTIGHDLNFLKASYENIHTIQFKNPSQALQAILRETGPVPTDDDRRARKAHDAVVKKRKAFDLEKMADAIYKLGEDDLLHVIQLIHDNKSDDTYIVNNPDAGEFSIDLYTMPDNLCRIMWDFLLQTQEGHRLK